MKSKRLAEYRTKRTFSKTPEPPGRIRSSRRHPIFVIQKHEASRLHYDFRLEISGVLASWALPKGPSLNPADKRLAMRTEDHPADYAAFEGVIPEGQYGAGTVMVWDRGTYQINPDESAAEQLEGGKLKFTLKGHKLRGGFALIRAGSKSQGSKIEARWFLIKRRDGFADPKWRIDRHAESVLTGRTLKQVTEARRTKRRSTRDH
ncbi:MAG: DNA ligase [Acidobacteria bacterium]|nr:DNA ligase [Acidobacteriota bacterium]